MSADFTRLKAVDEIGYSLLSDQLEINIISYFQWALLGVGGFSNVTIPSSGAFGGDRHRLRPATDSSYLPGQVWQGYRSDWVWETGVDYSAQPIRVSGVFVNGAFQPSTGVGPYAHHVDYPQGRVVFDSPLSSSAVINCEHSYRYVQFTSADVPWFREVQSNSLRVDDPQFSQQGSGAWSVPARNRVQLPAVVVEVVPRTTRKPLAIGGGSIVRQDVLFHVVAETSWDRGQLHDAITSQWQKRLVLFDKNLLAASDGFPLDAFGSPAGGARNYPDLIKPAAEGGFGWRQLRMEEFSSVSQPREVTAPLYVATVRGTFEVDMP